MYKITIPDDIHQLDDLSREIATYAESAGISEETLMRLNLVVEELFVNFVHHGLSRNGQFELSIEPHESSLHLTLKDNGRPFNPLDSVPPDVDAPLEDRSVGQLGLHLVRQLSRELVYERSAGCNVIRLDIPRAADA